MNPLNLFPAWLQPYVASGTTAILILLSLVIVAAWMIWLERRLLGLWQDRYGPNRVGPNLYGIVGEDRGQGRGFNFSAAMKAKGGKWTFDELDKFLTDPRGYVPGTAMTFAGLKNDQQRADVIDFLNKQSDHPLPLPKPEASNAPAGNAPAGKPPAGGAPGAQAPAKPPANPARPAC